jgi:type I restriction-modification system DNA methylase subunit
LTKEDFGQKTAIYLRPEAQFDYLVGLSDDKDRAQAIIDAMDAIEEDYETLKGVLPKQEYQVLDNVLLGRILRVFDDTSLKSASGDVFGRIYEYFLTQFADQGAHDNGEFFTGTATPIFVPRMKHGLALFSPRQCRPKKTQCTEHVLDLGITRSRLLPSG